MCLCERRSGLVLSNNKSDFLLGFGFGLGFESLETHGYHFHTDSLSETTVAPLREAVPEHSEQAGEPKDLKHSSLTALENCIGLAFYVYFYSLKIPALAVPKTFNSNSKTPTKPTWGTHEPPTTSDRYE